MKLHWGPDLPDKGLADYLNLETEEIKTRLSKIDKKWSRANNARTMGPPVCEETALKYAIKAINGATFPKMTVCRIHGTDMLGIISGNHRDEMVRLLVGQGDLEADPLIPVLCVKGTHKEHQEQIEVFTRSANSNTGKGQTPQQSLTHAMEMRSKYGYTYTELEKLFGVSQKGVAARCTEADTREKLYTLGVEVERIRSRGVILKLAQLAYSEPLMVKAASLCVQYQLSVERATLMVDEIKGATDEHSARAVVSHHKEQLDKQHKKDRPKETNGSAGKSGWKPRGQTERAARTRFLNALTSLHNVLLRGNRNAPFDDLFQLGVSDLEEQRHVRGLFRPVASQMQKILHNSEPPTTKRRKASVRSKRRATRKSKGAK